ncbi:hypothetical protein DUNSADRAFT_1054 [Dunaliella salina]|uniref:Phosphohydrolase n=1 Tax=Dunaliella salina TaxID=3046 RepID=A0ABQ7FY24_DUNSA|nr:hypothetical protein DUNSADRAFT_1054 [Dunaliella salina]|eukprot:KAF5827259.1 hypothetical protein DUNSADRAFT_1054 [Dunaliella salina]
MFELFDQADLDDQNQVVIALAVFFHDIVYDAKRNDNELMSIEVFKQFAADISLEQQLLDRVGLFIAATIAHAVPAQARSHHLTLFLDFDLAILGMPPETYDEYAQQIRQEYIHFPDDAYASGRAAVLSKFSGRDTLFFHKSMQERFEAQARENVVREIRALTKGSSDPAM